MYFVHTVQTRFSEPQLFEASSSELMPQRCFREKEGFHFFTMYLNSGYYIIIIIILL